MKLFHKKLFLSMGVLIFICSFIGCVSHDKGTTTPSNTSLTVDTDNDGVPNVSDTDIDGDGISNNIDPDIDGDSIPNTIDPDANGDGIPDSVDNNYISGIGVVAVDTVGYSLSINAVQKNGTSSATETIDLNSVRDEIKKNDIALSTFSLTNLSIIASGSNGFMQANNDVRIVVKVSYFDQNNQKILVLESAAAEGLVGPVLTVGDLSKGLELNKQIFGSKPGFSDFTDMVKDETKASVSTVIEITFLDEPSQGGGDLDISFILTASGKKAI